MSTEIVLSNTNAVAVPTGWVQLNGLALPDRPLTVEEEEGITLALSVQGDQRQWCRGDWGLYVRNKINRQAKEEQWSTQYRDQIWDKELKRLADRFACSHVTLQKNIACCATWHPEIRMIGQHVRYKHHELISRQMMEEIGEAAAREMLADCEAAEMSYRQFAVYVQTGELPNSAKKQKSALLVDILAPDPEDGGDEVPFSNWIAGEDDEGSAWNPASSDDELFGPPAPKGSVSISILRDNLCEHVLDAAAGSAAVEVRFANGNIWVIVPNAQTGTVELQQIIEVQANAQADQNPD